MQRKKFESHPWVSTRVGFETTWSLQFRGFFMEKSVPVSPSTLNCQSTFGRLPMSPCIPAAFTHWVFSSIICTSESSKLPGPASDSRIHGLLFTVRARTADLLAQEQATSHAPWKLLASWHRIISQSRYVGMVAQAATPYPFIPTLRKGGISIPNIIYEYAPLSTMGLLSRPCIGLCQRTPYPGEKKGLPLLLHESEWNFMIPQNHGIRGGGVVSIHSLQTSEEASEKGTGQGQ